MKQQLVNTRQISISNFTFDSKTNTISFFSTKTNKCWSKEYPKVLFEMIKKYSGQFNQESLNNLKKFIKNGKL